MEYADYVMVCMVECSKANVELLLAPDVRRAEIVDARIGFCFQAVLAKESLKTIVAIVQRSDRFSDSRWY